MCFLKYQRQNPEFLNNYLKYNRYIAFNSEKTVDECYFDLRTFLRYIKITNVGDINNISIEEFRNVEIKDIKIEDINKVTQNIITDFLFFLRYTLDNCPKARNKKLSSIKSFFEYLTINNLVSYNPTQNIKTATIEKRVPKHLNLDESKTLLSKTINSNKRFKIRNYAIICLFLNCSIRLSELVMININDFKLDERTLKVKGKGNCERIIYLNDATCEVIEEYLKVRPTLKKDNVDYKALFLSERNKRISTRMVQTIIEDGLYMTFNEKRKGFYTHTLRHTSATLMYNENNTNIFVIKKILGHKTISATEIYTHISEKKIKEIMEKYTISSILEKEINKNGEN